MEELILEGKRYISSKRAAHISGYTKDYIGQLCRAGSLPSRMVGRSWYVRENALKAHRKMYQGEPVVIETAVWDVDQVEERSTPLRDIAARYISEEEHNRKEELLNQIFDIKYEPDEAPLIPAPQRTEKSSSTSIVVQQAHEADRNRGQVPIMYRERPVVSKHVAYRASNHRRVRRNRLVVPIFAMLSVSAFVFLAASMIEGVTSYLDSEEGYYLEARELRFGSFAGITQSIGSYLMDE